MEVLILGMHRSGTSMVSGIINKLGVFGGDEETLSRSGQWNPKGYWEFRRLTQANNRILAALGGSWDKIAGLNDELFKLHEEQILNICKELKPAFGEFDKHGDWMVKDPRMCLLLPAWRAYLRNPLAVIVVRDPVEVAISLHKRNQMPFTVGIALWEIYMRSALRHSRGMPRILVDYNALLKNPEPEIQALREKLVMQGVNASARSEETLGFVDGALYRSRKEGMEVSGLLNRMQAKLYDDLRSGGQGIEGGEVSPGGVEVLELYEKAFPELAGWKKKWLRLSKRFKRD